MFVSFLVRGLGLALLLFFVGPRRLRRMRVLWDRLWTVAAIVVVLSVAASLLTLVIRVLFDHLG